MQSFGFAGHVTIVERRLEGRFKDFQKPFWCPLRICSRSLLKVDYRPFEFLLNTISWPSKCVRNPQKMVSERSVERFIKTCQGPSKSFSKAFERQGLLNAY